MKNIVKILPILFLLLSCAKREAKLELFSPESFAYELDNGWEIDGSLRAKGFTQEKNGENYSAKLSYYLDIVTPKGDTLKSAYDGLKDVKKAEEIEDVALEFQIEIDSTFARGPYVLIYTVHDDLGSQTARLADTVQVGN
jgi:hypothetical protein